MFDLGAASGTWLSGFCKPKKFNIITMPPLSLEKDDRFLSALNDHFTSKAPALTVWEPRVVECAAGSISHTWPSYGRALHLCSLL